MYKENKLFVDNYRFLEKITVLGSLFKKVYESVPISDVFFKDIMKH